MSEEPEGMGDPQAKKARPKGSVNVHEPMFIWIFLLAIAVVVKVVMSNTALIPSATQVYAAANLFSGFILGTPGMVILPLIVGAIIGAEVGARSSSQQNAMRSGLLNGIYASVIYVVTIIIIYIIINYATTAINSVLNIILDSVILPIVVLIITIEVFSILSHSRKVDE